MADGGFEALQSHLGECRAALDRLAEMLASMLVHQVSTGLVKASPMRGPDAAFSCANGHATVVHFSLDCPVCTMRRLAGYSTKWCEKCKEVTPHVGGMHVHATCVECLSHRMIPDAMLRSSRRHEVPDWRDV